jgi:ribonuclease P protein component
MLPRSHRLTRREDFRRVIRSGVKASSSTVIVHGLLPGSGRGFEEPARVGITVSRAVGGSVVRHRVARQIRHIIAHELKALPAGSSWVIRALPASTSGPVAGDIQRCLSRIVSAQVAAARAATE